MNSTLAKSLLIEGHPLQKKTLGKRKQIEEEKSSSESEPESESESESKTASHSDSKKQYLKMRSNVHNVRRRTKKRDEAINAEPLQPRQHTEANANAAAAIGENVGIIERRIKKRHEAINAAPLQPPQQGEADANPDAVTLLLALLLNTPLGDTETQEDHTKDADFAAAMAVEEDDTQHDAMIVDATIATAPPKHTVPAAEEEDTAIFYASIAEPSRVTVTRVESAEEENTHHNAMLVDAAIEMAPPNHIVPTAEEEDIAIADASIA
ncbi:hypothetical protein PIB30_066865 [Stylosanthes scabra]|uniref:Uncharacterized protein n=1 Tax=Stylosanthes scabra TaxID=79078 RepID=A0ABU6WNG9_9FABA|nr:hypothetical protein [Stylosanthes scabra]